MKTLKRTRYFTMNSWNLSKAPAYNLKVYNVIDDKLQDKVYEIMECQDYWDAINGLIREFDVEHDYSWQAGFNGRSGGYLVLYRGGKNKTDGHKSICTKCGQRNFKTIEETQNNKCGRCGSNSRINQDLPIIYSQPGRNIEDNEVPGDVLRSFRRLAIDIVKTTEQLAKTCQVEEEIYLVEKTRKVLS